MKHSLPTRRCSDLDRHRAMQDAVRVVPIVRERPSVRPDMTPRHQHGAEQIHHPAERAGAFDHRQQSPLREEIQASEHERLGADSRERSEEHTSELTSLLLISYAVFCLNIKK